VAMHIVDRRLNPGSKSLEKPPALPAPRQGAGFRAPSRSRRRAATIKDVLEGGEVGIPLEGMSEPRFSPRRRHARHGASR